MGCQQSYEVVEVESVQRADASGAQEVALKTEVEPVGEDEECRECDGSTVPAAQLTESVVAADIFEEPAAPDELDRAFTGRSMRSSRLSSRQEHAAEPVDDMLVQVEMEKEDGDLFGMRVAIPNDQDGLLIISIRSGDLLDRWSQQHPGQEVSVGDSITMVNGKSEGWVMMEELCKSRAVELTIRRSPSGNATALKECRISDATLRNTALVLRRTTAASTFEMCECAICMEDVMCEERVARMECGHGFHQRCIIRWMGRGESPKCPLCRCDME
jgi:hypothetical protein